jgi:quercetin dioxygenase-like cupin family protein
MPEIVTDSTQDDNLVYDIVNMVVYFRRDIAVINTIRTGEHRRTETPNATMTTLASPTLGLTAGLSMWQVEMAAGSRGPRHVFDSEQLWTVLEGELAVVVAGENSKLRAGDTVVLRADAERQLSAITDVRVLVCGHGSAIAGVPGEDAPRGTPPWIA